MRSVFIRRISQTLSYALWLFASASAHAKTLDQVFEQMGGCGHTVLLTEDAIWLGAGSYRHSSTGPRQPTPGQISVGTSAEPTAPQILNTDDAVSDLAASPKYIYALTYSALEVWSRDTMQRVASLPTTSQPASSLRYLQHPRALAIIENTAYIAHGRLGLTALDLEGGEVTGTWSPLLSQGRLESQAVDLVAVGHQLIIGLDNYSMVSVGPGAFRGFVVFDTITKKVVHRAAGLDPGLTALTLDGDYLIVSYDGPTWVYRTQDILQSEQPKPISIFWKYPQPGHPHGKPAIVGDQMLTCFHRDADHRVIPLSIPLAELNH